MAMTDPSTTVRAALVQAEWTGDKDSMIERHVAYAEEAAAAGAQVVCFQELFYGPYFCQVQDDQFYAYAEAVPDGPTVQLFREVAERLGIVMVLPVYEEEQPASSTTPPRSSTPTGATWASTARTTSRR
jgi:beta-ureidopropionase